MREALRKAEGLLRPRLLNVPAFGARVDSEDRTFAEGRTGVEGMPQGGSSAIQTVQRCRGLNDGVTDARAFNRATTSTLICCVLQDERHGRKYARPNKARIGSKDPVSGPRLPRDPAQFRVRTQRNSAAAALLIGPAPGL